MHVRPTNIDRKTPNMEPSKHDRNTGLHLIDYLANFWGLKENTLILL